MSRTVERTLAWCNRVRVAAGLKPLEKMPQGNHLSKSCPIARALNFDADVSSQGTVSSCDKSLKKALKEHAKLNLLHRWQGPKYLGEFVSAFDHGRYPELYKR